MRTSIPRCQSTCFQKRMKLRPLGLTGNLFAFHPKPLLDELLTSWLMRIAHGNGLKVHPFARLYFDHQQQIWNRDFDKCATDAFLQTIAGYSAISYKQALGTTLRGFEGVLYESHNPYGNTKWLLPIGIYHRKRKLFGLQYCPLCLFHDAQPYFRRRWRLAFHTACDIHRIRMHDRCPDCESPISFYRTELGDRNSYPGSSMAHCHHCGFDLARSPVQHENWSSWQMSVAHQSLLNWFDTGWSFATGQVQHYSHLYFDGLHQLCKLLLMTNRSPTIEQFRQTLQRESGIQWEDAILAKPFETQSLKVRHNIIGNAIWLTQNWPTRFLELSKMAGLRFSDASRDLHTKPFWFFDPIDNYLKQPNYIF